MKIKTTTPLRIASVVRTSTGWKLASVRTILRHDSVAPTAHNDR